MNCRHNSGNGNREPGHSRRWCASRHAQRHSPEGAACFAADGNWNNHILSAFDKGVKNAGKYSTGEDWLLNQFLSKREDNDPEKAIKASAYYGIFKEQAGSQDEAIKKLADKLKEQNKGNQEYDYQAVAEELDKTHSEAYNLYKKLSNLAKSYEKQRNNIK